MADTRLLVLVRTLLCVISDIFSEIQTYYPHFSPNMKNKMAIGVTLRSLGFQSTHTRSGNAYFAVFKKEKAA
ncbi:MAG: DUF3874 domain-containing protein [Prevotella sp.]|nr:DUF3874 domain-containing protein [Prevotella sp.]